MITKKDAQYIAHLSRIYLEDGEAEHLSKDLAYILTYIEKLNKLDIHNIEPTSHVSPLKNVFREDSMKPSLPQKDVMDMAIEKDNGSFKVPQVIT